MGADTKAKCPVYQCDECQREFKTKTSLKSHIIAKHPEIIEKSQQRENKSPQDTESGSKDEKKTAMVTPTSRASRRLQQKKTNYEIVEDGVSKSPEQTVFGCPKCEKVFKIYFTAYRHIQKRHCVDEDGNPVSPGAPDLIKPIRKETSPSTVKLMEEYSCGDSLTSGMDLKFNGTYTCLGCKKVFQSVSSFDQHIAATHCDNIDTMIFESFDEFLLWKSNMEIQVQFKYQSMSNSTQSQFYHCSYISPKNTSEVTHLCPSVLVAKNFSKGIQINYYKKHYEHICEYKMPKQFEMYILTGSVKKVNDKTDNDDNYNKFRSLMKSILVSAATVSVGKLKRLYGLAQEMQTCLNSYELQNSEKCTLTIKELHEAEEREAEIDLDDNPTEESTEKSTDKENVTSKSMNDDQISEVLERPRASTRLKRKSESSEPVLKKKKLNAAKAKAGLKESNAITKNESSKTKSRPASQSPTFADSYKQFIDQSLSDATPSPKTRKAKKEIVKTRIGQFTPSPKKTGQIKGNTEIVNTVKKTRSSSVISPKPVVDGASTVKKSVEIANSDSDDNSSLGASIANINLEEVEYEVLEQENDCNILVLKI